MENIFGNSVRFSLILCEETPKSFAEKVNLSPQYLSMLLTGKRNNLKKKKEVWDAIFKEVLERESKKESEVNE